MTRHQLLHILISAYCQSYPYICTHLNTYACIQILCDIRHLHMHFNGCLNRPPPPPPQNSSCCCCFQSTLEFNFKCCACADRSLVSLDFLGAYTIDWSSAGWQLDATKCINIYIILAVVFVVKSCRTLSVIRQASTEQRYTYIHIPYTSTKECRGAVVSPLCIIYHFCCKTLQMTVRTWRCQQSAAVVDAISLQ